MRARLVVVGKCHAIKTLSVHIQSVRPTAAVRVGSKLRLVRVAHTETVVQAAHTVLQSDANIRKVARCGSQRVGQAALFRVSSHSRSRRVGCSDRSVRVVGDSATKRMNAMCFDVAFDVDLVLVLVEMER